MFVLAENLLYRTLQEYTLFFKLNKTRKFRYILDISSS